MNDVMAVRGLVYHGPRQPATIEELRLQAPDEGEIRVMMVAAGVCRSDLHVVDGEWDRPSDVVLGHEGAGIVDALGPRVASRPVDAPLTSGGLRVGDLVSLAWTAPCGTCPACERGEAWLCEDPRGAGHRRDRSSVRLRRADGSGLGAYSGVGTFCSAQVVAEEAAIPIDPGTPTGVAALIGCAATTGIGAVRNTADVQPRDAVVIIGLGGVGLSALLAAVERGADPIVAVDVEGPKREFARSLGATHAVHPDALREVTRRLRSHGADHVLECIGLPATAGLALDAVRPGGTATLVGMPAMGETVSVDGYRFVEDGKRLLGSNYGSCIPARDFPAIATDVVAGRLPLERLISETIALDDIDAAFDAMRRREGARRIVAFEP